MTDAVESVDIAIQLPLLLQQVFHESPVVAVRAKAAEQKLGIGAEGCQRVAQLVHHQIELYALLLQLLQQPGSLQIKAEALGHCTGTGLQALIEVLAPAVIALAFSAEGAQQDVAFPQNVRAGASTRVAESRSTPLL